MALVLWKFDFALAGQIIMLEDYDGFNVSPSRAVEEAFLTTPRGFEFVEQLPADAHTSNFHASMVAQLANASKSSGVVKKAVAELCKPKCTQIALYGSYSLTEPWHWPHVLPDMAAPCNRAYVRVSEDGQSASQLSQSAKSVKSVS